MLTRKDFVLRDDIVFLNHGSFGSCPTYLLERQQHWINRLEQQPVLFHREAGELMRSARKALAGYIGAEANDLIYVSNATYGVNVVANALREHLNEGDEVLMTDHEYGACDRAWVHHLRDTGVKIVRQDIPIPAPSPKELAKHLWSAVTPNTKVIYLSHITSPTAVRLPIEEICNRARAAGIIMVIDGAHAPGHIDLNLAALDADFYTANCHKWMCTPKGSAFLWVNKRVQDKMIPFTVSWGDSWGASGDGALIDHHEYLGTRDMSAFLCVGDAVPWMKEQQWDTMLEGLRMLRNEGLTLLKRKNGLNPTSDAEHDELLMGAVMLPKDTDVMQLKEVLYDTYNIEVVVLQWLDQPILRFSVHAHTSMQDLEKLSEALTGELKNETP